MEPLISRPDDVRILVVDDDRSVVDMTATYLQREDDSFQVETATDPTAALDRLGDERIDCVVSDYEMPELDGLAFLKRVRELDEALPFVLFTARGSEEVAARAIEAGVDSYLRKGRGTSKYTVLANRVRTLVDQWWATRRAETAERTYELVARTATDAFWIRDMNTNETLYSEGIRRFGYEPGIRENGFEWWVDRVHPADRDASRNLNDLQEAGSPAGFDQMEGEYAEFTHEYRWRCADGDYLRCRSRGVVRFEKGEPVEMVGAMTDLGERG